MLGSRFLQSAGGAFSSLQLSAACVRHAVHHARNAGWRNMHTFCHANYMTLREARYPMAT